jgi:tetratricopeptide (TPR) repeat protein
VPYYREAVRLDPDYAVAYNQLGRTLEQRGRPDEALQYYQEALRAAPGMAAAHNNVGCCAEATSTAPFHVSGMPFASTARWPTHTSTSGMLCAPAVT